MKEPVRVLVVEDHRMFADALRLLLDAEPEFTFVGSADSGEQALQMAESDCPDVVLMDIELPGIDGIEATRRLVDRCPEAKVVAISALQPDEVMAEAIQAGAVGFVPKTQAADQLFDMVRRAVAGEIVLPAEDLAGTLQRLQEARRAREDAAEALGQLTEREREILQEIAEGKGTVEIGQRLFISPHTVHSHMRSMFMKLGVRSRLDAVLLALRRGVIELPRSG
jgi:DNA-binding NarL/FixJ family response regulator